MYVWVESKKKNDFLRRYIVALGLCRGSGAERCVFVSRVPVRCSVHSPFDVNRRLGDGFTHTPSRCIWVSVFRCPHALLSGTHMIVLFCVCFLCCYEPGATKTKLVVRSERINALTLCVRNAVPTAAKKKAVHQFSPPICLVEPHSWGTQNQHAPAW